mgnify:FL=1
MIAENGDLRCDQCGKKLGEHLEGTIEIVCPRCKRFNVFVTTVDAISKLPLTRISLKGLTKSQNYAYNELTPEQGSR